MKPNSLLQQMGYSHADRLVILHADDVGMCHASIQAFQDLWRFGTISSGALMVPCPWFPAAAQMCREHPEMDMGVHATLNSEWNGYRWRPLSTTDPCSGLIDAAGFLPQQPEAVYENATAETVAAELDAQIERALAAGIDITHIDSHMGTIMHARFVQFYLRAGMIRLLPNMLPRASARGFGMMGVSEQALVIYIPILNQLEAQGIPMLDGLFAMPLDDDHNHVSAAKKILRELPQGISHVLLHPAVDTPELRAICPDWTARVANYRAFMSDELKRFIKAEGIQIIGYRAIRDALRRN